MEAKSWELKNRRILLNIKVQKWRFMHIDINMQWQSLETEKKTL